MKETGIKFVIADDGKKAASSRFFGMYHSSEAKKQLITQTLAAGVIAKESGLLDILLALDEETAFREASLNEKGRRIRQELRLLLGGENIHQSQLSATTSQDSATTGKEAEEPQKEVKNKAVIPDNFGA